MPNPIDPMSVELAMERQMRGAPPNPIWAQSDPIRKAAMLTSPIPIVGDVMDVAADMF